MVNKQYLNTKFLKVDRDGNFFDLKQKSVKNCEPYRPGLFGDNDLVTKKYVDSETLRTDGKNSMSGTLIMNNQDIDRVKSIFFSSSGRLNMGGGAICNLGNPTLAGYAVTKGYNDDQTKKFTKIRWNGSDD